MNYQSRIEYGREMIVCILRCELDQKTNYSSRFYFVCVRLEHSSSSTLHTLKQNAEVIEIIEKANFRIRQKSITLQGKN